MSVDARWVRTNSDEAAVDAGCTFDVARADRVRYFFSRFLRHSKGQFAGRKFELLPWQWEQVVAPLYGWRRPDGSRRFRRFGIAVPKKNGKSTLLSGLSLYHLLGDGEPGPEVYSAGASRDQAAIIYAEAANMAEASDALAARLDVRRSGKRIVYPGGAGVFQALSADVPTKEGLNASCTLVDELHAQKTRDLWNVLRYAGAARRQPLLGWITTAGYDRASLCYDEWRYALAVLRGQEIDTAFLPVIYAADAADDWTAEATWRKANPSYGVTLSADDFAADCHEAQRSPVQENAFKRYRLNLWTQQDVKWISEAAWDKCRGEWGAADTRKLPCWAGLDLAATTDLIAFALLWRGKDRSYLKTWFWCPQGALKRRERENRERLAAWSRAGHLCVTDGDVADYNVIRRDINEIRRAHVFSEIGIDPWNASQLATDLQADGHDVTWVRTGFASISPATKEFEKLVLGNAVVHDGNPVMSWCVGNCQVEQDASGNLKPSKRRSPEKIDGVVASVTALARAIAEKPKKPSVYNSRGVQQA
jgi:phage terminase large subunit-like protein